MKVPADITDAFVTGPSLVEVGGSGSLDSITFAVKDLFDVRGYRTGAGNPSWLEHAPIAQHHALSVERLLSSGATLLGSTITDELAFSLSGTNVHYGTPLNYNAPGRIPGGSSAGSASAVAAGTVAFALGTDTAGSVRVPASYCGVWGLRPSHGRISMSGVVPLAPSFDTVGVLSSSGTLLEAVVRSLLDDTSNSEVRNITRLVVASDLFDLVEPGVYEDLVTATRWLSDALSTPLLWKEVLGNDAVVECRNGFRQQQMAEVWQTHGQWIERYKPSFGPGVAARFEMASKTTPMSDVEISTLKRAVISLLEDAMLPGSLLVVPVTPSVAPILHESPSDKERLRQSIIGLNSIAGISGAPELSCPIVSSDGLPIGIGVIGLPGDDELLCKVAASLHADGLEMSYPGVGVVDI